LKIRQIEQNDEIAVVGLLVEGFPVRNADYWLKSLRILQSQVAPKNQPQMGYAMEEDGAIVGVLLNIWTPSSYLKNDQMRANLSSWYVKPAFRSYAAMLLAKACRNAAVTYLNVSPAPHTTQICEAMGFKKYSNGQSICVPFLSHFKMHNRVFRFDTEPSHLSPMLDKLMRSHVEMGCLGLIGEKEGQYFPFLFVRRRIKGVLPAWQLIYVRELQEFSEFARSIGWFLLKNGSPLLICDGNERPLGMPGKFLHGKVPKYYKGPDRPELCDLSFTEIVVFGI
jgi:hypothetical protein